MSRNYSVKAKAFFAVLTASLAFTPSVTLLRADAAPDTANNVVDSGSTTASQTNTQVPEKPSTKWKPGEELSISTNTEDLTPTDDIALAQKQVQAYPDSPEASFILAVALTRTSRVEEALKEVRRARKLAEVKGGTAYFDKMIQSYEEMLKNYPNDNRVRYGLSWAYYMKAYLLANYSRKVAAWKAVNGDPSQQPAAGQPKTVNASPQTSKVMPTPTPAPAVTNVPTGNKLDLANVATALGALVQRKTTTSLPTIPSIMDKVDPTDVPQIKKFYEMALQKLDDLIAQKPDDVWAIVYRAHLKAEYTGNLDDSMKTWLQCREQFPNNPAAYFFLGEGYLKQGNLKESVTNVSRAVALRAMGF